MIIGPATAADLDRTVEAPTASVRPCSTACRLAGRWGGSRYVDDILTEVTRLHAERGATRITATTDLGNAPMAAPRGQAGYRNVDARIALSAPTAGVAR